MSLIVPSSSGVSDNDGTSSGASKHLGSGEKPVGDPYESRALGIWRKTSRHKRIRQQLRDFLDDSLGLVIAALIMTYPTTLQQVMSLLRCDTLDGDLRQSRLLAAPSLVCGQGDHAGLVVAAWVVLLLWGLGLPVFCGALLVQSRSHLNDFHTRCRLGMLGAEYEPRFFFWDAFILLRRFAATAAMLCAPAASRTMQLAILLSLGMVSLFIHATYMPFDNRSGLLLDTLEAQALKLFCATCSVLLLGFSSVANPYVCFAGVFLALIVHVFFMLRLVMSCVIQVQRSIADGVIDEQMLGRGPPLESLAGPLRFIAQRIFLLEVDSQDHKAHVHLVASEQTVELGEGPSGGDVHDFERIFVAQGLAESVMCAVTNCKLERLSTSFIEFASRLAFARCRHRLECVRSVTAVLQAKYKRALVDEGDDNITAAQRLEWSQSIIGGCDARGNMFDPTTFECGIIASDFQAELINIALFTRGQLDDTFNLFLSQKGIVTDSHLSSRDRLLRSVTSAGGVKRISLKPRNMTLLGDATEQPLPTQGYSSEKWKAGSATGYSSEQPGRQATGGSEWPREDPTPLQVTDLEAPATMGMRPNFSSQESYNELAGGESPTRAPRGTTLEGVPAEENVGAGGLDMGALSAALESGMAGLALPGAVDEAEAMDATTLLSSAEERSESMPRHRAERVAADLGASAQSGINIGASELPVSVNSPNGAKDKGQAEWHQALAVAEAVESAVEEMAEPEDVAESPRVLAARGAVSAGSGPTTKAKKEPKNKKKAAA